MKYRPNRFAVSDMRDRITIQKPTESQDSYGQPVVTWTTYLANVPASFEPARLGSGETTRGRQVEATSSAILMTRYIQGLTTKMRIVRNGVAYGILAIREINGGSRYLEISLKDSDG